MLLKPLPVVFGLQNVKNATRGALWRSPKPPAPGEPPALEHRFTYADSRSIAASRGGVLLPIGKMDVGSCLPPLHQHREPHRQLAVPGSPPALLCVATAPLITAWW